MTNLEEILGSTGLSTPGGGVQDLVAAWSQAPRAQPAPVNTPGWLSGFVGSAVQSFPEMIGKPTWGENLPGGLPAAEVTDWRAANPIASFTSQVLPMIPAYGLAVRAGAAIASRVVPALWESIGTTSAAGLARPLTTAWKREAVALLPAEAARIAAAAAIGDPGELSHVATSAGLDIALIPVIPAAWKAFQILRHSDEPSALRRLGEAIPELSAGRPDQERLAKLYDMVNSGAAPEQIKETLEEGLKSLELRIRRATSKEPLSDLVSGDKDALKKFFKVGAKKGEDGAETADVRMLYQSETTGYSTPKDWQDEIAPLTLPKDWLAYSEFPRVVTGKTAAKAAGFEKDVTGNMLPLPRGWHMAKEVDSELFVMAKKLAGPVDATAPGDKWFFVKTAQPNKILGEDAVSIRSERNVRFTHKVKAAEDREVMQAFGKELDGSVVAFGRAFDNSIPLEKIRDFSANNLHRAAQAFDSILPGTSRAANAMHGDLRDAWTLAKRFVAPAMAQFRKTPLAEAVRLRTQARFDAAGAQARALLYGHADLEDWQKPLARIFSANYEPAGLAKVFEPLKKEDMGPITALLNREVPMKDLQKTLEALTDDVAQQGRIKSLFSALDAIDTKLNTHVNFTEKLYGEPSTTWRESHYGVNHTWVGDMRRRISDEKGTLIAVASGRNPLELDKSAKELQARYGGSIGKERLSGQENDMQLANELYEARKRAGVSLRLGAKPGTMENERLGIKGYMGDLNPLDKKDLFSIVARNVEGKLKYQAELSVKHDLFPDLLDTYSRYGKEVGDQLVLRMNQMGGRKGAIDKATNQAVTRVLGKFLGTNSADKLAGAYNQAEATLTLMAGNLAHPALQAMSFIQTVLPKIAMFRGVPPGRWGEVMGILPEFGANGQVIGTVGHLDPILLTAKALKGIVRPDRLQQKMLARAGSDGVIAPKFLEEFVGQKSLFGESIKDAGLSGTNPVAKYLLKLSSYPATKMEELSRAHSFLTGHSLAQRLAPDSTPEWQYQFAKQFTYRTMYQYAAADKPRMFAGPLGGVYGLFKNWMFHNIADWSNYAGEAFLRNNWAPLLWATGGQAAIGGAASIPLIGLANGAYKMFSNSSAMQDLYEGFGPSRTTDALYFGLPAFFGVSLQGNASGPFSNPTRDINFMFNASVMDRAAKVGKFLGYVSDQQGLNSNPFESDRTWDLAAYAFGPRIMYKSMAQVEDGALKAIRNGQPIVDGITFGEASLNALGLTPTRIAKTYELSEELWANRERARGQTTRLGEAFAQGMARGDEKVMNFVVSTAVAHGYDLSSILRSATNRLRDQTTPMIPYEFRRDPLAWKGLQALGEF